MKIALIGASLLMLAPRQDESRTVTVADVVEWMTKETKRKFVFDETVAATFGGRRVSLSPETLDGAKAYEIGLGLLRTAGVAAVPLEEAAGGHVRLVAHAQAAREQLRVYSSAEALPKADEFATLALALRHADTRQVHLALVNLSHPQGMIMVEGSRMVLLSDYASNLRKLAEIVRQIDVPRGGGAYLVSVVLLEGVQEREASVPEAFKGLKLAEASGRNRFSVVAEASTRLDADSAGQNKADLTIGFGGARPWVIQGQQSAGGEGLTLERFTIRGNQAAEGPVLLKTRLVLRDGDWTIAGAIPDGTGTSSIVVLVRASSLR